MFEAKLLLLVLLLYVFGNAPWVVRNKRIVGAKKVKWSVCFIIALPKEQSETGEHLSLHYPKSRVKRESIFSTNATSSTRSLLMRQPWLDIIWLCFIKVFSGANIDAIDNGDAAI